jgi:hypothetical protein
MKIKKFILLIKDPTYFFDIKKDEKNRISRNEIVCSLNKYIDEDSLQRIKVAPQS